MSRHAQRLLRTEIERVERDIDVVHIRLRRYEGRPFDVSDRERVRDFLFSASSDLGVLLDYGAELRGELKRLEDDDAKENAG